MNENIQKREMSDSRFSNHEPDVRCSECSSLITLSSETCPCCGHDVYGFESDTYNEAKCESDFCDYMETTQFRNNRYTYPVVIIALIIILMLGFNFKGNEEIHTKSTKALLRSNSFPVFQGSDVFPK